MRGDRKGRNSGESCDPSVPEVFQDLEYGDFFEDSDDAREARAFARRALLVGIIFLLGFLAGIVLAWGAR